MHTLHEGNTRRVGAGKWDEELEFYVPFTYLNLIRSTQGKWLPYSEPNTIIVNRTYKPPGTLARDFQDRLASGPACEGLSRPGKFMWKTHLNCAQQHCMGWGPRMHKKEKARGVPA